MSSSDEGSSASTHKNKYKGIRCRKWGKWVSEIRVPGTQERLWLGSYATPEAAAIAHDIAFYCLRRPSSLESLNFPLMLPASVQTCMSPKSIQKVASDAGMAIDAQLITVKQLAHNDVQVNENCVINWEGNELREGEALNISIEDYL